MIKKVEKAKDILDKKAVIADIPTIGRHVTNIALAGIFVTDTVFLTLQFL